MTTRRFTRVVGSVGFDPLPVAEREHGTDDLCACRYCTADRHQMGDNPAGVWDTRATCLLTGKQWKVHFPELHGRRPKRSAP